MSCSFLFLLLLVCRLFTCSYTSCTVGCDTCSSSGSCAACSANDLETQTSCTISKMYPHSVCYYTFNICSSSAHCASFSGSTSSCTSC